MKSPMITRRTALLGGLTVASLAGLPHPFRRFAGAATAEEEAIIAAAKGNPTELSGMIWSNYMTPMQPSANALKEATGIGMANIQDISIFDIPQRAMAEALSRSPQFDFFHVDSNMIPSLASAGLLEPLDEYMKKANFKINAVGGFERFMTYKGNTYGVPTDGNVHISFLRKDMMEDEANKKAFEDKHGRAMAAPETWEEDLELMQFFHRPDDGVWGSANLRNRANGVTWWYMYLYSAGGFPFDDDLNPTLNTDAGNFATEYYLKVKDVSHPEAVGWGTPQMIPRIVSGKAFSCQYWDGIVALAENPDKSQTVGKWLYTEPPGSRATGKMIKRSISSPLAALLINKHSPRKEQAAYMAMWMATATQSTTIVADRANTFHDPWHQEHFNPDNKPMVEAYGPGLPAINKALQIASPPIYMTGYLEFQDTLAKNLSEAYVGQLKAGDVLTKTEEEWKGIVRKIGKRKLAEELASYKSVMPTVDVPS